MHDLTTTIPELEAGWLFGKNDALAEAMAARRRWRYILLVAQAAETGYIIDSSLPQITATPASYVGQAQRMVAALESWIGTAGLRADRVLNP